MKKNKTKKDIWNSFMLVGAKFSKHGDIPICEGKCDRLPNKLISYTNAITLYNKERKRGNKNFYYDAFIHFYIDDYKFDGNRTGIRAKPYRALEIIKHFAGIITPDFSTYADMPLQVKNHNTLRMRTFGYWISTFSIPVINNVRWGTYETWDICFEGIPKYSIVAIGTVASGLRDSNTLLHFERGFYQMIDELKPHTIIVYGSSNYPCFQIAEKMGIKIITFDSDTAIAYKKRRTKDEQEI